jgi:hypothetical protein
MATTQQDQNEYCRPLYIKRVPEATWIRVHENAMRSRMRLQEYVIRILQQSLPILPGQPAARPRSND